MKNQLAWWTIWFLIIVLSAFVVPFSFLSGITRITGAFLYWGVFALTAIISVGIITSKWGTGK
jgi:lauroyl/myristoyl acyltransferase